MIVLHSVLVATDFGPASDAALIYARDLARTFEAQLHVLHVADNARATPAAAFYPDTFHDVQTQLEESARHRLGRLLTMDDRSVSRAIVAVRRSSVPADAIVAYAKEQRVGLIVVGTHGRRAVSHLLLGSVAERVVRTAPCPVLVARVAQYDAVAPDAVSEVARPGRAE